MPIIRRARPDDADAIAAQVAEVQAMHASAHPEVFRPPSGELFPRPRALALMSSPQHVFVVADEQGEVLGHAYAEVQRFEESAFKWACEQLHLHQLAVRSDRRGAGIGGMLLAAIRDEAALRGIRTISLDVWAFNEGARAFYERAGFRATRGQLALTLDDLARNDA